MQDVPFSVRCPSALDMEAGDGSVSLPVDSPVDEVKERGVSGDPFDLGSLSFNPFGSDTPAGPTTVPTDLGTQPAANGDKPLLTSQQGQDIVNALIGGVEDLAHSAGIGPGSAATQQREAAAAQAKQQQQIIFGVIFVGVVGVVLWKLGVFDKSAPVAPAAGGAS